MSTTCLTRASQKGAITLLLSAYWAHATGIRTLLNPAMAMPFISAWLTGGLPHTVSCELVLGKVPPA